MHNCVGTIVLSVVFTASQLDANPLVVIRFIRVTRHDTNSCTNTFMHIMYIYIYRYSIKRSSFGLRNSGRIRQVTLEKGSIHMKFSMTGQERDDLLLQVTA